MKTVLPAAATKEAIRVAQKLLANEWIGIRAHHNGSRLITWSPTDHIGPRCIPGHDGDAADWLRSSRKTSGASGTLAMSNVPGANLLAAICCSRTLTNWRMRPHRSAAASPVLRATTRQYAAISTFCTSLHEMLGSLTCS